MLLPTHLNLARRPVAVSPVKREGAAPMAMVLATSEIQFRAQAALAASPFYELRKLVVENRGEVLVSPASFPDSTINSWPKR